MTMTDINENKIDKIINLCKRRGFILGSSEIYGGIASIYDYGPLGLELKKNLKEIWWKRFIQQRADILGVETSIIMHPKVWQASGHLQNFSDPLVECLKCHLRFREDHIPDKNDKIFWKCPSGGEHDFTEPKQFNLMFKTFLGATEETANVAYLRPETAQGMFVNFRYIQETMRQKIPFGIAQIGKSFRNELSLGTFIFRLREFEIAELEYFVKPGTDDEVFDRWVVDWENYLYSVGLSKDHVRREVKDKKSLAHYSKATTDLYYQYPHGWDEIAGIANRTDYDLKRHIEYSKKDLSYFDPQTQERYVPYVIEPTLGVDRLIMAVLCEGYTEVSGGRESNEEKNSKEIVLDLNYAIAPIKVAVFPLVKKSRLPEIAQEIFHNLQQKWFIEYDESGSIGRRYRRQDEIGTPFCITVDFDTLENNTVTIRDRRTMKQKRIKIDDLEKNIEKGIQDNSLSFEN